jgi:hypothetical protein
MGSVDGLRFRFFLFVGVSMAAESQASNRCQPPISDSFHPSQTSPNSQISTQLVPATYLKFNPEIPNLLYNPHTHAIGASHRLAGYTHKSGFISVIVREGDSLVGCR